MNQRGLDCQCPRIWELSPLMFLETHYSPLALFVTRLSHLLPLQAVQQSCGNLASELLLMM